MASPLQSHNVSGYLLKKKDIFTIKQANESNIKQMA